MALIAVGSIAFGNIDNVTSNTLAATGTTTTTTTPGYEFPASSTTSVLTVPATPLTTAKTTGTTQKPATATTIAAAAACASTPTAGAAGSSQAPAVGSYTYASCSGSGDAPTLKVGAGTNSAGVTRRTIESTSGLGDLTATDAFGPNGVIQESAKIVAFGFTLNCDWMPDITEYVAKLAIGSTWNVDSSCDLGSGAKLRVVGSRKIIGAVQFNVGGTKLSAWVIDEKEKLTVTAPGRPESNVNSTSTNYYDPVHGLTVYAKATTEASGAFEQPKTTTETYLTSLTPKS